MQLTRYTGKRMIVYSGVTKRFGDLTAIDNVDLAVDPGELVMITGHSGSGKTTLMKLLTREYQPSEGEIVFDSKPLQAISPSQLYRHRRRIGVVFQDYKLLPEYTVWENIALPLYISGKPQAEIEERVTDLLKLISLADKAFFFPNQLSGGEAQRVSIARALATAPSVIFADEPTGNLDPETTLMIAQLLGTINSLGTTLLIATHDLSVIEALKHARRITLDQGRVINDTKAHKTTGPKAKSKTSAPAAPEEKPAPSKSSEKEEKNDKSAKEKDKEPEKKTAKTTMSEEDEQSVGESAEAKKTRFSLKMPRLPFFKKKNKSAEPEMKEVESTPPPESEPKAEEQEEKEKSKEEAKTAGDHHESS